MANFNINNITANNILQAETINVDLSKDKHHKQLNKSYWHLIGNEQFGIDDFNAFRKSNLNFLQIDTKEKFFFLLNSELITKSKILYLHFSGHSSNNNLIIERNEDVISIEDIASLPTQCFETVLLASCENYQIVEEVGKISKHCVGFLNEIDTQEATILTEMFWYQILNKEFEEVIDNLKMNSKLGKFIHAT